MVGSQKVASHTVDVMGMKLCAAKFVVLLYGVGGNADAYYWRKMPANPVSLTCSVNYSTTPFRVSSSTKRFLH
jgi:hypothetical protein